MGAVAFPPFGASQCLVAAAAAAAAAAPWPQPPQPPQSPQLPQPPPPHAVAAAAASSFSLEMSHEADVRALLGEIVCLLRDIVAKLDSPVLSTNRTLALENYRIAYERQYGVSEEPPPPYEDGSYDEPD
jgi:hypothetical protein